MWLLVHKDQRWCAKESNGIGGGMEEEYAKATITEWRWAGGERTRQMAKWNSTSFLHNTIGKKSSVTHSFCARCKDVLNECHLMKKKALIKHLAQAGWGSHRKGDLRCTCWHFNKHLLERPLSKAGQRCQNQVPDHCPHSLTVWGSWFLKDHMLRYWSALEGN